MKNPERFFTLLLALSLTVAAAVLPAQAKTDFAFSRFEAQTAQPGMEADEPLFTLIHITMPDGSVKNIQPYSHTQCRMELPAGESAAVTVISDTALSLTSENSAASVSVGAPYASGNAYYKVTAGTKAGDAAQLTLKDAKGRQASPIQVVVTKNVSVQLPVKECRVHQLDGTVTQLTQPDYEISLPLGAELNFDTVSDCAPIYTTGNGKVAKTSVVSDYQNGKATYQMYGVGHVWERTGIYLRNPEQPDAVRMMIVTLQPRPFQCDTTMDMKLAKGKTYRFRISGDGLPDYDASKVEWLESSRPDAASVSMQRNGADVYGTVTVNEDRNVWAGILVRYGGVRYRIFSVLAK